MATWRNVTYILVPGSDDFLKEEGIFEEVQAKALKRALAEQLEESMQAAKLTKFDMARKMATSRSQLDRVLDPGNVSVQLDTLIKAARALGKEIEIEDQAGLTKKRARTPVAANGFATHLIRRRLQVRLQVPATNKSSGYRLTSVAAFHFSRACTRHVRAENECRAANLGPEGRDPSRYNFAMLTDVTDVLEFDPPDADRVSATTSRRAGASASSPCNAIARAIYLRNGPRRSPPMRGIDGTGCNDSLGARRRAARKGNEMTPEKHAVIRGYLTQAFAGHAIEEVEDHSHLTWNFKVLLERKSPLVAFSHEFVDDSEPEEIGALLKRWRVAEFMRTNPGMRVVVTTTGPTLRRRD